MIVIIVGELYILFLRVLGYFIYGIFCRFRVLIELVEVIRLFLFYMIIKELGI